MTMRLGTRDSAIRGSRRSSVRLAARAALQTRGALTRADDPHESGVDRSRSAAPRSIAGTARSSSSPSGSPVSASRIGWNSALPFCPVRSRTRAASARNASLSSSGGDCRQLLGERRRSPPATASPPSRIAVLLERTRRRVVEQERQPIRQADRDDRRSPRHRRQSTRAGTPDPRRRRLRRASRPAAETERRQSCHAIADRSLCR